MNRNLASMEGPLLICSFLFDTSTIVAANQYFRFWLVDFSKASLKLLDKVNRNLVESIYGRSCIDKDCSFRPDPLIKTVILVSGWSDR